ncbi:MAG: hypothetical protein ACE5LS_07370, partial [Thermoplasmata archaeon]
MALLSNDAKIKSLWYLLLSAIGVFHAEVLSGSSPDVLYNPFMFALVTPVYAVHYVLFGHLMGRHQGDTKVLYLFGCLTGMYETFITKVYFSPPWNPGAVGPGGIAWVELLWIGFTWHAFLSFLIPFRLMQGLYSPANRGASKARDLKWFLVATPLLGGVLGYGFGRSAPELLLPLVLSFAVLVLLSLAFLWGARRWGFRSTEQLRLGRRGRAFALGAFVAVYVAYGVLLRPEFLPLGLPLVLVALIYAGLVLLTRATMRGAEVEEAPAHEGPPDLAAPFRYLLLYFLAFL